MNKEEHCDGCCYGKTHNNDLEKCCYLRKNRCIMHEKIGTIEYQQEIKGNLRL